MVVSVTRRVFAQPQYVLIASLTSLVIFTIALWLPNLSFVSTYLSSSASVSQKLQFIWSFYGAVTSSHTLYSASIAFLVALLSGVNIALLVFYTKRVKQLTKGFKSTHAGSYLGIIVGFFGVGCAACGSVILVGLLSAIGAGGLLFLLPFRGAEVGVVALLVLLSSNYFLIKKINDPLICRV